MRAVNLIPADAARGGIGPSSVSDVPVYALVGVLTAALLLSTMYVLSGNTISERKAKLANLREQVAQEQTLASRLATYVKFNQLAQTRAATVRQIASTRFDWHTALADLSKVVPANTSLQSLVGTVAPGASVSGPGGSSGGSGASTGALRGAIAAPAFELKGCTRSHQDVARLISRLRTMNGVTRVTLADSLKQDSAQTGTTPTPASGAASGGAGGCGGGAPTFDLVVFFTPLAGASAPGAGPTGTAPSAATGTTPSAPSTTTPASTTPLAPSTTTGSGTPTAASTTTTTGGTDTSNYPRPKGARATNSGARK